MTATERFLSTLREDDDFLCALATVGNDGCPRVRYMKGVVDDQLTIRCPTFLGTQKVQDITHCAEVSITCGDTDPHSPGSYFQIAARAVVSQEMSDRELAWTPRLAKWFRGIEDPNYAVIKIEPRQIIACPIGGGPVGEVWKA